MKEWDPDDIASVLKDERLLLDDGDEVKMAERIFRENLPLAAHSIVHLAMYSTSETVRMRASQYIVERNMGTLSDAKPLGTGDPFEDLLADCVRSLTDEEMSSESLAHIALSKLGPNGRITDLNPDQPLGPGDPRAKGPSE